MEVLLCAVRRRLAALALVAPMLVTACAPRYRIERPPLPEPTADERVACYRARRLALARGSATWSYSYQQANSYITETWGDAGVAFYRGDRHVHAEEVLSQLADRDLARGYEDVLASTRGAARRAGVGRALWVPLVSVGLVAVLVGSFTLLDGEPDGLTIPLVGGGGAMLTVGLIPLIVWGTSFKDANEHHVDQRLFRRSEWGPRLIGAVAADNAKIAAECGVPRAADLPMTDGARGLLGAEAPTPGSPLPESPPGDVPPGALAPGSPGGP